MSILLAAPRNLGPWSSAFPILIRVVSCELHIKDGRRFATGALKKARRSDGRHSIATASMKSLR